MLLQYKLIYQWKMNLSWYYYNKNSHKPYLEIGLFMGRAWLSHIQARPGFRNTGPCFLSLNPNSAQSRLDPDRARAGPPHEHPYLKTSWDSSSIYEEQFGTILVSHLFPSSLFPLYFHERIVWCSHEFPVLFYCLSTSVFSFDQILFIVGRLQIRIESWPDTSKLETVVFGDYEC